MKVVKVCSKGLGSKDAPIAKIDLCRTRWNSLADNSLPARTHVEQNEQCLLSPDQPVFLELAFLKGAGV
jgi:hypothetical protein